MAGIPGSRPRALCPGTPSQPKSRVGWWGDPLSHSYPQLEQTGVRSHFPAMLFPGSALGTVLGLGMGDLEKGPCAPTCCHAV